MSRVRLKKAWSLFRKAPVEAKIFAVSLCVAGPFLIFFSAPMQAPDESLHYWRAYQISEFDVFGNSYPGGRTGYEVPQKVKEMANDLSQGSNPKAKMDINKISHYLKENDYANRQTVYFENAAIYSPAAYIPQASGIGIGKILHLPVLVGFYLGRVINLMFYILFVFFALKYLTFGRRTFLVLATMPMSLFLAASLSPDATLIGLTFLIVSLVTNVAQKQIDNNTKTKLIFALLATLIVSLTKNGYFIMSLLFLAVPAKTFSTGTKGRVLKFLPIIGIILLAIAWQLAVYKTAENIHSILKPAEFIDAKLQIETVITNPLHFAGVILNTLLLKSGSLLIMSFVGVLGWLDIVLPFFCYILVPIALLIATLKDNDGHSKLKFYGIFRFVFLGSVFLLVLILCTSLYLGYSPVGSSFIDGLQGRYFIPVAILLVPAFMNLGAKLTMPDNRFNKILICYVAVIMSMTVLSLINSNILRVGY